MLYITEPTQGYPRSVASETGCIRSKDGLVYFCVGYIERDTTVEQINEKYEAVDSLPKDDAKLIEQQKIAEAVTEAITNPQPDDAAWTSGEYVMAGHIRTFGGVPYECIQSHLCQAGYEPPNIPALWKVVAKAGEILPWRQPAGAHDAYDTGDKVTHNGKTWASKIPANTTEPGSDPQWWEVA